MYSGTSAEKNSQVFVLVLDFKDFRDDGWIFVKWSSYIILLLHHIKTIEIKNLILCIVPKFTK